MTHPKITMSTRARVVIEGNYIYGIKIKPLGIQEMTFSATSAG